MNHATHPGLAAIGGTAAGLYHAEFEGRTGSIRIHGHAGGLAVQPSFCAYSAGGQLVYAVANAAAPDPDAQIERGRVYALRVNETSGDLVILDEQALRGTTPCYVAASPDGRLVATVCFREYGCNDGPGDTSPGSICIFAAGEHGALGAPAQVLRHAGSSVHPLRQSASHPHAAVFDSTGAFLLAPDLGIDRVAVYRLQHGAGEPALRVAASANPLAPGSGPRHVAISPCGERVYVVTELANTIAYLLLDRGTGALRHAQTVSTLPAGISSGYAADIHLAPSGRLLYASNRGHDSIAVFAVERENGALTPLSHFTAPGFKPSEFTLDPSGEFLIVPSGEQYWVLRADQTSGVLDVCGEPGQAPGRAGWIGLRDECTATAIA